MLLLAICEDSQSDRRQIENLIADYSRNDYIANITTFDNGEGLINHYNDGKPAFDIIFLDIYMSNMNGIETAKQLRNLDPECKIIFTTSSVNHALESFEVFPLSYLIKPVSNTIFDSVFEKAIKTINLENQKILTIKIGAQIRTILNRDILFIESTAKMLNLHGVNAQIISFYSKLDDIEEQLADHRFIRCHKSFLVNMNYISCVENNSFKLIDNTEIPVTQRNFASIKKAFYTYIIDRSSLKTI